MLLSEDRLTLSCLHPASLRLPRDQELWVTIKEAAGSQFYPLKCNHPESLCWKRFLLREDQKF